MLAHGQPVELLGAEQAMRRSRWDLQASILDRAMSNEPEWCALCGLRMATRLNGAGRPIPINIQPVEDFYAAHEQEWWDLKVDFPNCAPPFQHFWTESGYPDYYNIGGKLERLPSGRSAMEFLSQKTDYGWSVLGTLRMRTGNYNKTVVWPTVVFDVSGEGKHAGPPWLVWSHDRCGGPCDKILTDPEIARLDSPGEPGWFHVLKAETFAHWLAISFMHCKNVTISEDGAIHAFAPQAKINQRNHEEFIKFRHIDIHPMTKILEANGVGSGISVPKALHICRGHFKDYRQRGLFGKIHGLFWWDQHLRGSAENGVIAKDYTVYPGQATP